MQQIEGCKTILSTKEHKNKMFMTPKEFSEEYGIGWNKTYQLVHMNGFPKIKNGNRILIIRSKVDGFFENNIGLEF
ncbi:MAG: helix-turn-helix domain-containing protein [Romboutsia sp.]